MNADKTKKPMSASRKRALRLERKYLDRAILRFVRTLSPHGDQLDPRQQRELLGLAMARSRVQ
jgi:hypothetical protein